jgi:hypothetical protein
MTKVQEIHDWEDFNTLYITGGHYSMDELKNMYPDGYDDFIIAGIEAHGFLRHEYLSESEQDDYGQEAGYIWYNKKVTGAVTKATKVNIEERQIARL